MKQPATGALTVRSAMAQSTRVSAASDKHGRAPAKPATDDPEHARELPTLDAEQAPTTADPEDAHAQSLAADALEEALDQIGPFGLYQRYTLAMLCLPSILAAMYSLNYVFTADQVPFRCVVPECEGPAGGKFWNSSVSALLPEQACRRYLPLHNDSGAPPPPPEPYSSACSPEYYHPRDTLACESFVYESNETIYAEFNLACREWLRTLVGSVRNAALPFALVLTGYLSDTFGRRTALCVFSACAGVLGVVKGFSVNYRMYLAMEFLEAALGYGFNSAAYVLMVELARPSLRAAFACATGVAYGVGGMLLALLAAHTRYWRKLLWSAHAAALLLPLYWLLLDESWRWLHARGRRAEAAAVVRKAARWNKVTLNEDTMKKLSAGDDPEKEELSQPNPWLSLLRSRVLMARFGAVAWCWVAAAFVYYGLTINSVSLAGDKYVNFALNMSMEIVASLFLVMALERFGRKWSICAAFLLCGVACVTPFLLSHAGASLGMFFVGKLSITFAFNSLYVFSAELFPTRARSSALGACSLASRLGSILAPQTPLLSVGVQAAAYGACSVLAAAAVALVPETRRARLPSTVAAAERLRAHAEHAAPAAPAPSGPRVLSAHDT